MLTCGMLDSKCHGSLKIGTQLICASTKALYRYHMPEEQGRKEVKSED